MFGLDADSYPVAIYVFWEWEKIGGRDEGKIATLFFHRPFPWNSARASTEPPIFSHRQNT